MGLLAFTKNSVLKAQSGISIVEGLVGLGAIAGLAAVIATISTNTNDRSLIYRRACESMAVNAIDSITDEAIFMDVAHFTPSSTKTSISVPPDAPPFSIDEILDADLWQGATNIVDPAPNGTSLPPVVRTEVLIQGAMRALNALYNNSAGVDFCGTPAVPAFEEYAPMSIASLGIENELTRSDPANPPVVRYNLQRVQWDNNNVSCPAPPMFIAPIAGLNSNQRAFSINSYDSLHNDLGVRDTGVDGITENSAENEFIFSWRLTAQVEYTHKGETFQCQISRDFRYPEDAQAPSMQNVTVQAFQTNQATSSRPTDFEGFSCRDPLAVNDREVDILIQVDGLEAGSLLFCRDISEKMVYSDPADPDETTISPVCMVGDNTKSSYGRVNPVESKTSKAYIDYIDPSVNPGNAIPTEDKWYPCHEARICGGVGGSWGNHEPFTGADLPRAAAKSPRSAVVLGAAAELSDPPLTISLNYDNVSPDCLIGLQVIAVDVAGNVSGVFNNHLTILNNLNQERLLIDPASPAANPFYDDGDVNISGGDGGAIAQDHRAINRPWCGNRNGQTQATLGTPTTNTWGTADEWGVLCMPATSGTYTVNNTGDSLTPNWETTLYGGVSSANQPLSVGTKIDNSNDTWRDEFPNGYYTCRPGGCCFSMDPNVCTPWSSGAVGRPATN